MYSPTHAEYGPVGMSVARAHRRAGEEARGAAATATAAATDVEGPPPQQKQKQKRQSLATWARSAVSPGTSRNAWGNEMIMVRAPCF